MIWYIRYDHLSIWPNQLLYAPSSRSTENDHVKSTLPAKLRRVRTFGVLPLTAFKDLITAEEYQYCEKVKPKHPTWFSLTITIFITFLYRVSYSIHHISCICIMSREWVLLNEIPIVEGNINCGRWCSSWVPEEDSTWRKDPKRYLGCNEGINSPVCENGESEGLR